MQQHQAILAIDTATSICSVSIFACNQVVFEKINEHGRNHAALITGYARQAIEYIKQQNLQLVAIAVNEGPGSYTGLRIGASFAKGLAFGYQIPLIAISGLKALANAFSAILTNENKGNALICPMIDARRMEVYTALYTAYGDEAIAPHAQVIDESSFSELPLEKEIYFIGDGALKCASSIKLSNKVHFQNMPSYARNMLFLATEAFDQNNFVDVAYWQPDYIKTYNAIKSTNKVLRGLTKE